MPLTDAVRSFLQQPLTARLSVIDDKGYPHTVPIWYALEEDPGNRWLGAITHRYEPRELADQHLLEWSIDDLVLMRFKIAKAIRM